MATLIELTAGAIAGPAGPPGPSTGTPPPNVLNTSTAAVFYGADTTGALSFGFQGRIDLPTSDPDYSAHFKRIDAVAIDPSGGGHIIQSFTGAAITGTSINYSGLIDAVPSANQSGWKVRFIPYNEGGAPNASPFESGSLTVDAPGLSFFAAAEDPGARYQDASQGLHTVITFTVTLVAATYPQRVTIWNNFDDGRGDVWQGNFTINGPAQVIRVGDKVSLYGTTLYGPIMVPPPGRGGWVAKAYPTDIGSFTDPSSLPDFGTIGATSSYSVIEVAAAFADDVTNAKFDADPSTGDILTYVRTEPGVWLWNYYQLEFLQPTLQTDPNYWFTFVTVQKGYESGGNCSISGGVNCTKLSGPAFTAGQVGNDIHIGGVLTTILAWVSGTQVTLTDSQPNTASTSFTVWNPAPDKEGVDESTPFLLYRGRKTTDSGNVTGTVSVPNTVARLRGDDPADWTIPPTKNADGTSNPYVTYRMLLYCASHINDTALGNNAKYTLQTIAWPPAADGSQDHFYLNPQVPGPGLNLAQAALPFLNSTVTVLSQVFGVAPSGISNPYLAALAVATANIQSAAVSLVNMQGLSVDTAQLVNLAVATVKIANLAVGTGQMANLSVTTGKIQNAQITTALIASAAITAALIANLAVGTAAIQNLAVTDAKINDLSVGKLTAGTILVASDTTPTITVKNASTSKQTITMPQGIKILDSGGNVAAQLFAGSTGDLRLFSAGALRAILSSLGPDGFLALYDSSTIQQITIAADGGVLNIKNLPSASAGSGSFWYDAADSNRVHYTP